jgi:hypothetical protein
MGVLVAGIAGALIAVPVVAALNAVATYLAGEAAPSEMPIGESMDSSEPPPAPGTPA